MLAVEAGDLLTPSWVEFLRSATTATASVTLCQRRAWMGRVETSSSSPLSTTSGMEASSVLTSSSRSSSNTSRSKSSIEDGSPVCGRSPTGGDVRGRTWYGPLEGSSPTLVLGTLLQLLGSGQLAGGADG